MRYGLTRFSGGLGACPQYCRNKHSRCVSALPSPQSVPFDSQSPPHSPFHCLFSFTGYPSVSVRAKRDTDNVTYARPACHFLFFLFLFSLFLASYRHIFRCDANPIGTKFTSNWDKIHVELGQNSRRTGTKFTSNIWDNA